ncbi:MAG: exo-alpha-sialidase [Phycisphaerales bacterium]|nr:exo-alpha-sialidase [Phycisphaerales bacterium]
MSVQLLIGTDKGAFLCRSDSARRNWKIEGPHYKGWKVTAAERTADGGWLLGTASYVYGAAIHAGRDVANLKQVGGTPRYEESLKRPLTEIWRIVAARDGACYAGVMEAGLFRSSDGGERWSPVDGLNEHPSRAKWQPGNGGLCAHSILADPKNSRRIWCGISAVGVWRSDDGGDRWRACNAGVPAALEDKDFPEIGFCVHALQADPAAPERIWRQDHLGMFRSTDAGASWERIENGLPSRFGFPLGRSRSDGTLYAVPLESDEYRFPKDGRLSVCRSRNDGQSWEAADRGLPQTCYANVLRGAMDTDGLNPCGVYFGTTAGDVFASPDGGDSWTALPARLPRVLCVRAATD